MEFSLRRLQPTDVDEWLAGEDEEQKKWFEFPRPSTRQDVERAVSDWSTNDAIDHWGIEIVDAHILAGGVELRRLDERRANLSYVVFPPYRRNGIATRAARRAIEDTRFDVTTIVIKILAGNEASLGVARNLNATEVGTEPSDGGGTFRLFELRR